MVRPLLILILDKDGGDGPSTVSQNLEDEVDDGVVVQVEEEDEEEEEEEYTCSWEDEQDDMVWYIQ